MSLNPLQAIRARRAAANTDTYTAEEWASFREVPAEGKALRRQRRRRRLSQLMNRAAS